MTRGSCSTAMHQTGGGQRTCCLSGDLFSERIWSLSFAFSIFPFYETRRFSIFAGPRNSIRPPHATISGNITRNEQKSYILTIQLMSFFCTGLYQPSLLFKIGWRYRRPFVTLLDIFYCPRNCTKCKLWKSYSLLFTITIYNSVMVTAQFVRKPYEILASWDLIFVYRDCVL